MYARGVRGGRLPVHPAPLQTLPPTHPPSKAFIPGPIIGIVSQPLIGVVSDNLEHRLGRRRPLIISAAILLVVSYTTLANAYSLGNLCGDKDAGLSRGDVRPWGVGIAVVSFWSADFAINAAALPCRALATDVVPARLQNECNSGFSIMVRCVPLSLRPPAIAGAPSAPRSPHPTPCHPAPRHPTPPH